MICRTVQAADHRCALPARQLASYSHVFPMAGSLTGRFLLPLLTLINHDGVAPNVAVERNGPGFRAVALRNISAGEQLTYRFAAIVYVQVGACRVVAQVMLEQL